MFLAAAVISASVVGSAYAQSSASGTRTSSGPVAPAVSSPPAAVLPPPATTFSFTLASQNPTAVPLSAIVSGEPLSPTVPLESTASPGVTPTFLPNAPPLPNAALLLPANYPTLDRVPPTDSPQVAQWIAEVANSGVSIPNITPTVVGGCPANAAAAADTSRCWWTCGGCTRNTDIQTCPDKMTWGLTYDDGPANYTSNLIDYLDQVNLKTTFFVVGSRVISYPATLQLEYMKQHQIAVHTWSHPPLTTLTNEQIIAELGWSKKVIKDVLGVTPNMMRPPFGDIDDRVRAISIAMGLTPVLWTRLSPTATFDTGDFNINGGLTSVQQVLSNWNNIISNATVINSGFIVLEHDLFEQSVQVATGYILPDALAHQPPFRIEPVVTCLNKPLQDAYIETNNNSTNPPVGASASAAVTLSSGAAGSAQSPGSGKSNDAVSSLGWPYVSTLALAALIAGASIFA